MAIFDYKGVAGGGKQTKGVIDADSSKTARQKLKQRGVYVTEIRERAGEKKGKQKNAISFGGGVGIKNLTLMTRQLSTMIKARIPLDEALEAIVEQTDDPAELTTLIESLLADEKRLEQMRAAGFAHARKFTWEASAKKLADVRRRIGH